MAQVPFPNVYRLRTATGEGSCAICFKVTPALLITTNVEGAKDWFYCCAAHVKDPNVCTCLNPPPAPPPPAISSPRGNSKAKDKKGKSAGDKKEDKPKGGMAEDKAEEKSEGDKLTDTIPGTFPTASSPAAVVPAETPRGPFNFALHRSLFYFRESEYRKKVDQQRAAELAKRFPDVPSALPTRR
ncbi:hypothetical protein IWQ60_009581 [Tieghemiomyces parasiticus]|uniref:VPS4-associated protein 1 n=1 Tax=Tieghemiomyces parasiticus TaxID=78921 RepID=A0A9W7ZVR3_9FUNG|nr:hypothetical protein IWQ60_009581 [Tieghemiomyces parasiticus]